MSNPRHAFREIDRIVAAILAAMSLIEKALIANMDEQRLPYLQYAFDVYISREIADDPEAGQEVMKRIWRTLHDTHRIRLVGKSGQP